MNTGEVFRKASELLAQDGAWLQLAVARNAKGERVEPKNSSAVMFSADGALEASSDSYEDFTTALLFANRYLSDKNLALSLAAFNDWPEQTSGEVVRALQRMASAWDKEQALKTLADEGQKCDGGAG